MLLILSQMALNQNIINAFKKDNRIIIGVEIPGNMKLTSEILYRRIL